MTTSPHRMGAEMKGQHSPSEESVQVSGKVGAHSSIQCQFCSGRSFRRSRLRKSDLIQILRMRYPVRCLRCGERQMVNFMVAGLAISSKVEFELARQMAAQRHASEPTKK